MNRLGPPYRGTVTAAGFVIDVALIGTAEAQRRVLAWWQSGAVVRELGPDRWLMSLPTVVELRCELAPGLPVVAREGGYAPADVDIPSTGKLCVLEGGRPVTHDLKDLHVVEPSGWIDLSQLTFHVLAPVQAPPPAPGTVPRASPPPTVDLRSIAKLGVRSSKAQTAIGELTREGGRQRRGSAGNGPAKQRSGFLARSLMRSPAAPMIRRKHERYLHSLTEAFERKRFDEALRDAIALGGNQAGFLSLRLPKRREVVRGPSNRMTGGGGTIPWGSTVHQHLQTVYRQAADELEKQGRFEEAAFVLVDLMTNLAGAVAMLERHQKYLLAAELAEGHKLQADLVVRLWWRAGRRDRALEVARARGAYAMAIKHLENLDPEAAGELRVAWSDDLASSGDYLGAVEAIWPDADRRATSITNIVNGMSLGGPTAAHLFAFQLALATNDTARAAARSLMSTTDPALAAGRSRFLRAFSELPSADPAADRELASVALRQLLDPTAQSPGDETSTRRIANALVHRADPVLRADLPSFGWHRRTSRTAGAPFEINAVEGVGQLAVHDAVPLPGGTLLVALGSHGVRLLTPDGRTRAQWDRPTERIVMADHGGAALLANDIGDGGWDLHTLDLTTRQVRAWLPIRATRLASSYDGAMLTVVDDAGTINFLDVRATSVRSLWREVTDEAAVVDLARGPGKLSAVVRHPASALRPMEWLEVWHWDLPSLGLRSRGHLDWLDGQVRLTTGGVVQLEANEHSAGSYTLATGLGAPQVRRIAWESESFLQLITDGVRHAVISSGADGTRLAISPVTSRDADLAVQFPDAETASFRTHHGLVAVWDLSGRIVVADLENRQVLGNFRTRL